MGTLQENYADMVRKGRRRTEQRGEDSHRAKLSEEEAKKVLLDPRPYAEIAATYRVARSTITSIKNRESWAHIEVGHIPKNGRGGAGRRGRGEKLNETLVREIRVSVETGVEIAARLGIAKAMVTQIRQRTRWAHVTD
jgi:hypothetical protein